MFCLIDLRGIVKKTGEENDFAPAYFKNILKEVTKEVVEENAKKYEKIERTTEENQQEDEELEEEDEEAESYFSDARQSLADWCGENM